MSSELQSAASTGEREPAWGAVFAMAMGVLSLVTAEFLPASLLTPLAQGLHISEGLAGQAVTATAVTALVTSLLISTLTRGIDRKRVLISFSLLLVISNLLVAFATGFGAVLAGRILLGIALGGFWAMAPATAMRLVPASMVPRALSIIFSGLSIATLAAAPLGSYFEGLFGWRNVFVAASVLGVLTVIAQLATLPSLPPQGAARLRTLVDVLRRPSVGAAMLAATLVFTGHFLFFTYMRGSLEQVTGVGVNVLSAMLLGYGAANFVGTPLSGRLIERHLRPMLIAMPALMVALGVALVAAGRAPWLDAVLVAIWGFAFGGIPVAWSTWVSRAVPDEAESAGGLIVAAIQLAIAIGAALGGVVFDARGADGVFLSAAIVLVAATLLIVRAVPSHAPVSPLATSGFH